MIHFTQKFYKIHFVFGIKNYVYFFTVDSCCHWSCKISFKKLQGLVIVKMKLKVKTWKHPVQIPLWSESGVGKEDHCPEKHKFLSWSHKKHIFVDMYKVFLGCYANQWKVFGWNLPLKFVLCNKRMKYLLCNSVQSNFTQLFSWGKNNKESYKKKVLKREV